MTAVPLLPTSSGPDIGSTGGEHTPHRAKMAILCAGLGGAGKTSTALALAQRAAKLAPNKSVVLIDVSRGQGDIRSYLRLDGSPLPSVLNAALSGEMSEAVLTASQITAARHPSLPPICFSVVLAPPVEAADPLIVTARVYQQVIDLVRRQADLVILDTQIIEIHDTSGLVDGLIVPALTGDAYGLALTGTSSSGVQNLISMLRWFADKGVPAGRLLVVLNRVLASYDTNVLRTMLNQYGQFTGAITENSTLAQQVNMGRIPDTDPALAPALDAVLRRVTNWLSVEPAPAKRSSGRAGMDIIR